MKQAPVNIKNKRATFDYELTDTYTAGIVLTGTEIITVPDNLCGYNPAVPETVLPDSGSHP